MFLNFFIIEIYRSFILHFQLQTEVAGNAFAELDQRLVGDLEMFCHNFLLLVGDLEIFCHHVLTASALRWAEFCHKSIAF